MDCIFCKIVRGEIPSKKVFENGSVLAFEDIEPISPVHILVVPKTHVISIDDLKPANASLMTDIFLAVRDIAREKSLSEDGYRVIINNGKAAGQVVEHLHVHVLGGQKNLGHMLQGKG